MESQRLVGLDALRGVAALCVFAFHLEVIFGVGFASGRLYLAVDFFFILSGFVMAYTYESRFANGLGPIAFLSARYRRFFVPMAIGTALGLLTVWGQIGSPLAALAGAFWGILLLPLFFGPGYQAFPYNTPAWSIFAELVANFVHIALLRHLRVKSLFAISITAAVVVATRCSGLNSTDWLGIPRILIAYPLGIAIFRLFGTRQSLPASLGLGLVAFPLIADLANLGFWADFAFALLIGPVALLAGLAGSSNALLRYFGDISFPLYAVHLPIFYIVRGLPFGPALGVIGAIALATLISYLRFPNRRAINVQ